jgi:hypothetical protein
MATPTPSTSPWAYVPRRPQHCHAITHSRIYTWTRLTELASIQNGFYFTIATIPAAWGLWYISRSSDDSSQPFLTRMIDGYTETAEKWSKRNDLHVRMIEQAGEDRVLFMNTKPHEHVEMKFPEYV